MLNNIQGGNFYEKPKKTVFALCLGLSLAMVAPAVATPYSVEAKAKPKLSKKSVSLYVGGKATIKVKNGKIKTVKTSKKSGAKVKKKRQSKGFYHC